MTEKHEIKLSTDRVDVIITTNDLSDLSSLTWFKQLLELDETTTNATAANADSGVDVKKFNSMVNTVESIRKVVNQLVQREQQRDTTMEQQRRQPEAAGQDMQQPKKETAPSPRPSAETEKQDFMDIEPEEMESDIWESLSSEQRKAWQSKYMS